MIAKTFKPPSLKIASPEDDVARAQRLRLRRFGISVATYGVAILATFLITLLGIGDLVASQWAALIGLSLFGVSLFYILFSTRANLRFSEPSLTREQIVYSFLYAILAMYWLPEARPIILLFFLPPFSFGVLSLTLRRYLVLVGIVLGLYSVFLSLEYLQNRQDFMVQYQLLLFAIFSLVLTWFACFGGFVSNIRQRLRTKKEEIKQANEEIKAEVEERKLIQLEKENMIEELKEALLEVKTLSGLLPICASCKNIRDDNGYWNQIEYYIKTHSEAEFSHSICPDCVQKLYPDLDLYSAGE